MLQFIWCHHAQNEVKVTAVNKQLDIQNA